MPKSLNEVSYTTKLQFPKNKGYSLKKKKKKCSVLFPEQATSLSSVPDGALRHAMCSWTALKSTFRIEQCTKNFKLP